MRLHPLFNHNDFTINELRIKIPSFVATVELARKCSPRRPFAQTLSTKQKAV